MAKGSYQVIFSGKILEHADIDMVKNNVARVFSLPEDRVEKLFSGRRLVLKKDVDQATAERYKTTLHRAGALCEIEDLSATEPVTQTPTQETKPQAPQSVDNTSSMTVAEAGSQIGEPVNVDNADIDTSGLDMAEVGITLTESQQVPDADIDTGSIDLAEAGVTLAETEMVADANIDTSGLDMDEVGTTLAKPEEFLEAEFDLTDLSLDEAGTTLAELESVPDVNIDTSKLSLD